MWFSDIYNTIFEILGTSAIQKCYNIYTLVTYKPNKQGFMYEKKIEIFCILLHFYSNVHEYFLTDYFWLSIELNTI